MHHISNKLGNIAPLHKRKETVGLKDLQMVNDRVNGSGKMTE